jgi:hypothetical protein
MKGLCSMTQWALNPERPQTLARLVISSIDAHRLRQAPVDSIAFGTSLWHQHHFDIHFTRVCILAPKDGDRVLEKGTEDLIKLLDDVKGPYGVSFLNFYDMSPVPFVVVFTQFDRIIAIEKFRLKKDANYADWTDQQLQEQAIIRADKKFNLRCNEIKDWANNSHISSPTLIQVSDKRC